MSRPASDDAAFLVNAGAVDRVAHLLAVEQAARRYLAASNTLAFRPTKEIETEAAKAHHDLTEALNAR